MPIFATSVANCPITYSLNSVTGIYPTSAITFSGMAIQVGMTTDNSVVGVYSLQITGLISGTTVSANTLPISITIKH